MGSPSPAGRRALISFLQVAFPAFCFLPSVCLERIVGANPFAVDRTMGERQSRGDMAGDQKGPGRDRGILDGVQRVRSDPVLGSPEEFCTNTIILLRLFPRKYSEIV